MNVRIPVIVTFILLGLVFNANARFVGSEINYAKNADGSVDITYRFFKSCDEPYDSLVSFESFVFAKDNPSYTVKLNPKFKGVRRMRPEVAYDSSVCSGNPEARYVDYLEINYTETLDPGSVRLYYIRKSCEWVVDINTGTREFSTTLSIGYDHYNYCEFNRCRMKIDQSPVFIFTIMDVIRYNGVQGVYFTVTAFDTRNTIRYALGPALHRYDSSASYRSPFTYQRPVKLLDFGTGKNYCNASPPIGLCLKQSGVIIYSINGFMDNPTFVIEAQERVRNCDGTFDVIGVVRRDFTLHYVPYDSMVIHDRNNYAPQIILKSFQKGFLGDTVKITANTSDYDNDPKNLRYRDSLTISFFDTIAGATYFTDTTVQPGFVFEWIPTEADVSLNPYNVIVKVNDNYPPLNGVGYAVYPVYVLPEPEIRLDVRPLRCGRFEVSCPLDSIAACFTERDIRVFQLDEFNVDHAYFQSSNTFKSTADQDTIIVTQSGSYQVLATFKLINGETLELRDTLKNVGVTSVRIDRYQGNGFCPYTIYPIDYAISSPYTQWDMEWYFKEEGVVYSDSIIQYGPRYFGKYDKMTLVLKVKDSLGCVVVDSMAFYPLLTNQLDLGQDTAFCKGDVDLLLELPVFEDYLWSTGDTNSFLHIDTPGTYSVIVTNNYGCAEYDTLQVREYKVPSLPEVIQYMDILSARRYGIYAWFFENTFLKHGPYREIKTTKMGTYKLVYYDENGCPSDTGYFQYTPVSIDEVARLDNAVRLYPNPVKNDELFISFLAPGNYVIRIFDATGRMVRNRSGSLSGAAIITEHMAGLTGLFFVEITFQNMVVTGLLTVE